MRSLGQMTIDDDFALNKVPKTRVHSFGLGSAYAVAQLPPIVRVSDKLHVSSIAKDGTAHTTIKALNADREVNLFDEEFYIELPEGHADLAFTVHSSKRQRHQTVNRALDASNAEVVKLHEPELKLPEDWEDL